MIPQSPTTLHRRRPSSSFSLTFPSSSPQTSSFTPSRPTRSRKSSIQSIRTPTTPRPPSSHSRNGDLSFSNEYGLSTDNGLGSLADELAEAWDEDGEAEEGISGLPVEEQNPDKAPMTPPPHDYQHDMGGMITLASPAALRNKSNGSSSPPKKASKSKHKRKDTEYDGSDYGNDSDFEDSGMTPLLDTRLAVIESLARAGLGIDTEEVGGKNVFTRVSESLRDLSSQSNVENHTTRLATAHTALTSHLSHQTRILATLTHPLLTPLSPFSSPSFLDDLLPLLSTLLLSLPQPPPTPLPALHALSTCTADLASTLSYLSDTLHMMRQTTNLGARRLRAARELVATMKREMDVAEEGRRWLEQGGWEERLRGREAARVCGEVVGGFEKVCGEWRERLVRQGGGVEVGAG